MEQARSYRSVVIVDDTDDVRYMLRIMLERDGRFAVVGEAGDGESGVRAVSVLRPDVVVLDLAMPHMDGLQALPLMRQSSPDSAVVVLSAFRADLAREQAMAAGAVRYVEKGTSLRDLVELLHQAAPAVA